MSDAGQRTLELLQEVQTHLKLSSARSRENKTRTLELVENLARFYGLLSGPATMATVEYEIGTGGHYSSPVTWEADLDNGLRYSSGDDAVGKLKNQAFDEEVDIDGGSTLGLNSITLTAAEADRHDGTAGSGARIVRSAANGITVGGNNSSIDVTLEWVELDLADNAATVNGAVQMDTGTAAGTVRNCLIHNVSANAGTGIGVASNERLARLHNNIIYNINGKNAGGVAARGIRLHTTAGTWDILNNTIYNVNNTTSGSGRDATGIVFGDRAGTVVRNNIVIGTTTLSGTTEDYDLSSVTNATLSHNISSDATASGTGSLTNETTASVKFVSTVAGSEDFHILSGSVAEDAGVDLGTTPAGIEIDIDGNDRTGATTWDIGAHELELTSAGGVTVTPAAAIAEATTADPVIVLGAVEVSPSPSIAEAVTIDPTVLAGGVNVTPSPAIVEAAAVDPSVEKGPVSVVPAPAVAEVEVLNPIVIRGAVAITPVPAEADALTLDPTVFIGGVVVTPLPAVAEAVTIDPTVVADSGVVVTPLPAIADAIVADPGVTLGGVVVTPAPAVAIAATYYVSNQGIVPTPIRVIAQISYSVVADNSPVKVIGVS